MKRFAIIVCALALATPALAQDATGAWELTVTTSARGPRKTSMTLKNDGGKLSGTLIGPQGVELALTGTQSGADIALSFKVDTQNGPLAVVMKGRQDGDAIQGTLEVGTGEDRGDWTASRRAAASGAPGTSAVDISGTWAYEVNTDVGVRMATVTLNQQGETLSGRYKSQLGEAPLTGKIKDASFTFQVTLPIEGTPMTLTYKGTVDGNAVTGDVNVADLGAATFTGKKQGAGGR